MVCDTAKVTIDFIVTNRKSYTSFSIGATFDDLEGHSKFTSV